MPHIIRKPGILGGTTLAVFMTLVHTVNDAMTAILGALLPTLQVRFDAGPTALALMIAVFWIASSVTQPVFGALGEDVGLRLIGCVGVLMAPTFLSLIGVASELEGASRRARKSPGFRGFTPMGGTGLEPVTPSLSNATRGSSPLVI